MERRLLHAQKLESLGVLAGGIAHDFNNLLMAILGNPELALRDLPRAPRRGPGSRPRHAARRAADLTRQMLAYSGKGSFVVARAGPERAGGGDRPPPAHLDPKTDAETPPGRGMPCRRGRRRADPAGGHEPHHQRLGGHRGRAGRITLSTGVADCDAAYLGRSRLDESRPAGRYVYLEVADTGCGMDEQTRSRSSSRSSPPSSPAAGSAWPRCSGSCGATAARSCSTARRGRGPWSECCPP